MAKAAAIRGIPAASADEAPIRLLLRRLLRHRSGQVGLAGVIFVVALAIFGPSLTSHSATSVDPATKLLSPSVIYPFGTDQLGRDVLTRILYGAALSLPLGLLVGYSDPLDLFVMRILDVMMAIPALVLALAVIAVLGPGLNQIMLALGIAWTPYYARMARAQVKQAKTNGYVEYAIAAGASDRRIMAVHLLQSVAAPIIVMATIGIGDAILSGSALSFIGLGAPPPTPEWGAILRDGREFLRIAWWISVFPGLVIILTVVAFNLLGDALRDTLDPRVRRTGR
jgi:peptide/nickel transport system permease protein